MYPIEDNFPIPESKGRRPRYPIRSLEVGQSFMVPGGNQKSLTSCTDWVRKQTQRRFSVRVVDGGVRVWRVE